MEFYVLKIIAQIFGGRDPKSMLDICVQLLVQQLLRIRFQISIRSVLNTCSVRKHKTSVISGDSGDSGDMLAEMMTISYFTAAR